MHVARPCKTMTMRKGDTLGRQMMLPTGCRRRKQLHRKASRHVERSRQSGGLSKTWMPMALQACSTLTLVMPSSTMFTGAVCSCSLPSDGFNAAHPKQKITLVTTWLTSRSSQAIKRNSRFCWHTMTPYHSTLGPFRRSFES
jgi:hypothetical protein